MSMIFIFILVTALPTASAFQQVVTNVRCSRYNWDDIFLGDSDGKGDYGGNDGKMFEKTCQKSCHDSRNWQATRGDKLVCGYSYRNAADLSDDDNVVVDVVTTINIDSCGDPSYARIADWNAEGRRAQDTNGDTGSNSFWICVKRRSIGDVKKDIDAGKSVQVVARFAATIAEDPMSEPLGFDWEKLGKWDNHDRDDAIAFATDDYGDTKSQRTNSFIWLWQTKVEISLPKSVAVYSYWAKRHQTREKEPKTVTERFSFKTSGENQRETRSYKEWEEKITKSNKFHIGFKKHGGGIGFEHENKKETMKLRQDELKELSRKTFEQDREVEITYTISAAENGESEPVNLWYWVVTAKETDAAPDTQEFDDSFSAQMTSGINSIVKSKCGYDLPPNCLPGYCDRNDPNCFKCEQDWAVIDEDFEEPEKCTNECRWKAVPSNQCPKRWELESLKHCSEDLNHGDLCQTSFSRLPNDQDAEIQNCGTQNVFQYDCVDGYSKCWIYNIGGNACGDPSDVWYEDIWGRDHGSSWDSEENCFAEKEGHEEWCEAKSYFCYAQDSSQCSTSDNVCSEHPGAVMIPETSNGNCGRRPAGRCGRNGECCSCCDRMCSRREGSAVGDEDALALENRRLKKTQAALMKALKALEAN